MVAEAKRRGLPVSADVSMHHLYLTEMDVIGFNSLCHVRPPLRSLRDREGLRRGLAEGVITAITSDHQPHDRDAKDAPFGATEPGISGLETLLPLALSLVEQKVMGLSEAIASLTCQPAQILGLYSGHLGVGAPADVCIFDPEDHWTLTEDDLWSAGKNTPFLHWQFKGRVTHTLLGGRLVYEAGAA
jgi:dihydroorotase